MKRGHFGDPMGWPGFFWNSVKITGNLSSSEDVPFQPLLAAGDSLFWAPFPTPHTGPVILLIFRQSLTVISLQKGAILETCGLAWIFLKFCEIVVNLSSPEEAPFRTLIADKDSLFPAPFPSPPHMPIILAIFRQSLAVVT